MSLKRIATLSLVLYFCCFGFGQPYQCADMFPECCLTCQSSQARSVMSVTDLKAHCHGWPTCKDTCNIAHRSRGLWHVCALEPHFTSRCCATNGRARLLFSSYINCNVIQEREIKLSIGFNFCTLGLQLEIVKKMREFLDDKVSKCLLYALCKYEFWLSQILIHVVLFYKVCLVTIEERKDNKF